MGPSFPLARGCAVFRLATFAYIEDSVFALQLYFYFSLFTSGKNIVFFVSVGISIVLTFVLNFIIAETFAFNALFKTSMWAYLAVVGFVVRLFVFGHQ
jgi:hypothetical protein